MVVTSTYLELFASSSSLDLLTLGLRPRTRSEVGHKHQSKFQYIVIVVSSDRVRPSVMVPIARDGTDGVQISRSEAQAIL